MTEVASDGGKENDLGQVSSELRPSPTLLPSVGTSKVLCGIRVVAFSDFMLPRS